MFFESPEEIAADDLGVIEVELDAHVRPLHLGDDVGRLLGSGEEIVRPVARIDRLDQQRDVLLLRRVGDAREIPDEGHHPRRPLLRRHLAGEAMSLTAADGGDVGERLLEQRGEFALAAGDGGDAELARRRLTGRGVDAEHGQAVAVELGLHGGRRVVVGELQLDRPKTGRGRSRETFDQRALGEKISEIGGEARHAQIHLASLPGIARRSVNALLTRQSIHLLKPFAKKMDARIKPGHDDAKITGFQYYSMLDSFHIAVLPGDGIGPEVMAPALAVLDKVAASTAGLKFRFTEAPAGAGHYRDTGKSMPASTIKLCEEADAILLGACGLPHIRYPDNTEIMPQVELRFI